MRGAIQRCDLGDNIGNEKNELRPVFIVSCDLINSTSGNVVVIPLSKTLNKKRDRKTGKPILTKSGKPIPRLRSHLFLFKDKYNFLNVDSALLTDEMRSISKVRLKDHMGTITDAEDLQRIAIRIKWSVGV